MVRFFNVLWVLLIFAVCFDAIAQGNTFYISTNGKDSNNGSSADKAWKTIGKANQALRPGDVVYLLKGTYEETIQPNRSGEPGNYITYARYKNDEVIITNVQHGVDLGEKSYIAVDGLSILSVRGGWVNFEPRGNHCIIRNCFMEEAGGYNGLIMMDNANYNKIINNTLKATCTGDDPDTALGGPNDLVTCFNSAYNLFDGNKFYGGIHNGLNIQKRGGLADYNIIRNNYFECRWHGSIDLYKGPAYTLIENNIIVDGGEDYAENWCGTVKDRSMKRGRQRGIKAGTENSIIRGNVMINDGYGIELHGIKEENTNPQNNHIYNNTFFNNYNGLWLRDASAGVVKENKISNNILYKNKEYNFRMQLFQSENYDNGFFNNNIFDGEIIKECNQPFTWEGNVSTNPEFVNEGNRDVHLSEGSPMIDAGTFLTVTSSAGNGKVIPVEDAYFFTDGWGMIEGDEIQLEGQQDRVRITKINYNSNTLTVNQNITWEKGQGVSLPYSGKAPDMGAYELDTEDGPKGDAPPTQLNLKVNNITGNTAELSWNDNSNGKSGFILERKIESDKNFEVLLTTQQNVVSYTDKNLTTGTTYYYRVKAENNVGNFGYSNTVKITTLLPSNTLPQAVIKVDHETGDFPLTVNFDATNSKDPDGEIVTYSWNFGDGGSGQGKTISHIYKNKGDFTAKLTVTDDHNGKSSKTIIIKVGGQTGNALPVAVFSVNIQKGNVPLTVKFDANASSDSDGTVEKYHWDFGDGGIGYGRKITYIFKKTGDFIVKLKVIDDQGDTNFTQQTIQVNDPNQTEGKTYYISASQGNDNNSGLTETAPWKTLNKVNNSTFSPGDFILFKKGDVWKENLVVQSSGLPSAYIQIAAYGTGDYPRFMPGNASEVIRIIDKSYVSVSNIHVTASPNNKGIDIAGDARYVQVMDCKIEGHAKGTSSVGIVFSDINAGKYPTYPSITNCEIFNFKEGASGQAGLKKGGLIADNTIHAIVKNGTDLIRAVSGNYEGLVIKNNELTGWRDDAVDLYNGSNIILEYNQIHHPAFPLAKNGSGNGVRVGGTELSKNTGNIIRFNQIYHLNIRGMANFDGIVINFGDQGKIYGNLIYTVRGNAIAIAGSGHIGWEIYNNTAVNAKKSGIYIGNAIDNIFLSNNIFGGKKYDILMNGPSSSVIGKNNVLLNYAKRINPVGGRGKYQATDDIDMGSVNFRALQLFSDKAVENFTLAAGSPAIDAGIAMAGYDTDMLGKAIKNEPDLGAMEFQGNSSQSREKVEVVSNQMPVVSIAGGDREVNLPLDTLLITGMAYDPDGKIVAYQWSYEGPENLTLTGDKTSELVASGFVPGKYVFRFSATDDGGLTVFKEEKMVIKKENSKIIASKAFSPNGDGIDDFWIIDNVELIENCQLRIFNRAGQSVFEANPYQNNWDATRNGSPLPSKDYYYIINCNDSGVQSGGIRVIR